MDAGFHRQARGSALDAKLVDDVIPVKGGEAIQLSRDLARKEGIFVGISAGATLAGALEIAHRSAPGTNILCMLPGTGERYLSTPLFDDIPTDMTAEEIEISRSTPRFRFDTKPQAAPAAADPAPISPDAERFVAKVLADGEQPVVMFALEWCEFCWSVRKLFKAYDIPYRSIDLDSAEYQKDNWGGELRKALRVKTSSPTISQIFIGGEHIGGCTDTFDAFNDGRLTRMLSAANIAIPERGKADAYSFLPKWLQAR